VRSSSAARWRLRYGRRSVSEDIDISRKLDRPGGGPV
jgi:hypothetical protein